ncbi:probable E3 ubiquitin-protein ligase RHY1A [Fagus crenata]
MAGMLPGVECARRRRFHPSGGLSDSPSTPAHGGTRRSCLSLYPTSNETHHTSISLLQKQAYPDVELRGVAREAKERLDQRLGLKARRKSETKRDNTKGSLRCVEVSGSKMISWAKFSWKVLEQGKCAVC